MNRWLLLVLLPVAALAVEQLTVLVEYTRTIETDDEAGTVTTNHVYSFSAPQRIGQSKDARSYATEPTSAVLSNDITAATRELLKWRPDAEAIEVKVVLP